MILVDTSVWVSHFREVNPGLKDLLFNEEVICHPLIIGEMACGHMRNRKEILSLLQMLPRAEIVQEEEILPFVKNRHLFGLGIGIIDVHLLASSLLTKAHIWTYDKKLHEAANRLDILYK